MWAMASMAVVSSGERFKQWRRASSDALGSIFGEGEGAYVTLDGDMVTWKGSALGRFKEKGASSHRGILYYRTASEKLARLNAVPGVIEIEFDADGNDTARIWEWKGRLR